MDKGRRTAWDIQPCAPDKKVDAIELTEEEIAALKAGAACDGGGRCKLKESLDRIVMAADGLLELADLNLQAARLRDAGWVVIDPSQNPAAPMPGKIMAGDVYRYSP